MNRRYSIWINIYMSVDVSVDKEELVKFCKLSAFV